MTNEYDLIKKIYDMTASDKITWRRDDVCEDGFCADYTDGNTLLKLRMCRVALAILKTVKNPKTAKVKTVNDACIELHVAAHSGGKLVFEECVETGSNNPETVVMLTGLWKRLVETVKPEISERDNNISKIMGILK